MGIDLHAAQERFLNRRPPSYLPMRLYTSILATGRRWGKTEAIAYDALEYALLVPGSQQCIASVSLDQARLAWDKMVSVASHSELIARMMHPPKLTPFPTFTLVNGSTITARSTSHSGKYIRGHKFHRVFVDEAEYVKEVVLDDVVRMTLADVGGELIMTTTPRRSGSYVHRQYNSILDSSQRGEKCLDYIQSGSSFENPYIDHEYIRSQRMRMTEGAWLREVEGIWTSGERAVFRWEDIQRAYLEADWELPEDAEPRRRYIAGWDLAKEQDWTVGIVLDATQLPLRLVYFDRFQQRHWQEVAEIIKHVHYRYQCTATVVDATGLGAVVLDMLGEVAQGFVFTKESKVNAIYNLQVLLEHGHIRFPFVRELVDELNIYEWEDKELQQDCVMALAIACWTACPLAGRGVRADDILMEVRGERS